MINNVVLTGKVIELPVLRETANALKYATIAIEVTRPFKNSNNVFDTDRISVTVWRGIAETAVELCKVGDLIGIKGRVQSYSVEKANQTYYNYEIVAEHVSFLNS